MASAQERRSVPDRMNDPEGGGLCSNIVAGIGRECQGQSRAVGFQGSKPHLEGVFLSPANVGRVGVVLAGAESTGRSLLC